jgi:hypothetical protein
MSLAPRSEDWPYRSRRILASRSRSRSISSRVAETSASAPLALSSAANRAARSARIIACAPARSSGRLVVPSGMAAA